MNRTVEAARRGLCPMREKPIPLKHKFILIDNNKIVRDIECDGTFTIERARAYAEQVKNNYSKNQNVPITQLEIK